VCQTCLYFAEPVGDLHIGILGDQENICLLPNSDKGQEFLQSFDALEEKSLDARKSTIRDIQEKREENKKKSEERLQAKVLGLNGLVDTFSKCIACHNCMKACPICYCRLCYFDSGDTKHEAKDYLNRAKKQGSLQFPADKLFFHSGRMSHMSLSCVGCGSCEDACPASIPVAQIFNFIGEKNQAAFSYQSGMNREEKIPLIVYKQEELEEFED
jgi:formate dehydrogenase subunit beta